MIVNVKGKIPRKAGKSYIIPWFCYLTYEGKNKFIYSLFDSLALIAGELRFNDLHYNRTDTLNIYCKKAATEYSQQISFIEQYCDRHNIGIPFKKLAISEVFGAYIVNLLKPLERYDSLTVNDYSKPYREILMNCKFNDPSIYFKTTMYSNATYNYSYLVMPIKRLSKNGDPNRRLNLLYNTIKLNFKDSVRNHLLTNCLSRYILTQNLTLPSLDSLLTDFKSINTIVLPKNWTTD